MVKFDWSPILGLVSWCFGEKPKEEEKVEVVKITPTKAKKKRNKIPHEFKGLARGKESRGKRMLIEKLKIVKQRAKRR